MPAFLFLKSFAVNTYFDYFPDSEGGPLRRADNGPKDRYEKNISFYYELFTRRFVRGMMFLKNK